LNLLHILAQNIAITIISLTNAKESNDSRRTDIANQIVKVKINGYC